MQRLIERQTISPYQHTEDTWLWMFLEKLKQVALQQLYALAQMLLNIFWSRTF